MYQLSGSIGAGKIWHEVMETMLNSTYNKETAFDFGKIHEYQKSGNIEYGLASDHYETVRNLLETSDLILQPHNYDTLQYTAGMSVPLLSKEQSIWSIDTSILGQGINLTWQPEKPGTYIISARTIQGKSQKIKVVIKNDSR